MSKAIQPIVIDYIKKELNTPNVRAEKPAEMSGGWVIVTLKDDSTKDHLNAATIEITVYHDTKAQVLALYEELKDAMDDITNTANIVHCKRENGKDNIDTASKKYNYRCFYNLKFF